MRRRCRDNWRRARLKLRDDQLMYVRMNPRRFYALRAGARWKVAFETVNQFLSAHRFAGSWRRIPWRSMRCG